MLRYPATCLPIAQVSLNSSYFLHQLRPSATPSIYISPYQPPTHPSSPRRTIDLTLDLHLDRALTNIRRRLKRIDRILQIEPMRHQLTQIQHPTIHQPNRPRPRIRIPILELQIDLLRTQPHERHLHIRLPHPDHKHLPPEFHAVDGRIHRRFHPGALERHLRLHPAHRGPDALAERLRADPALDFVGPHARAELLGHLESGLLDIGDDDGFGAPGGDAEEGDEPDGPRAADQDGIPEGDLGAGKAAERDREGFQQRAVLERHVADLVAPHGGVVDVAPEQARDGWGGEEAHVEAAVVAAGQAGFAVVAD